jgi:hypothetical protein
VFDLSLVCEPQFQQCHMSARDDWFDLGLLLTGQRQAFGEPFHHPVMMGCGAVLARRARFSMQEHRVRDGTAERSGAEEHEEPSPQFQSRRHDSSNPLLIKQGNGFQLFSDQDRVGRE